MAKWHGKIGFSTQVEYDPVNHPHSYKHEITEKEYYGNMTRRSRRWNNSGSVNDNLTISNTLSVIADTYITDNIGDILYVNYLGKNWKVSEFTIEYPHIEMTLGGLYNGKTS